MAETQLGMNGHLPPTAPDPHPAAAAPSAPVLSMGTGSLSPDVQRPQKLPSGHPPGKSVGLFTLAEVCVPLGLGREQAPGDNQSSVPTDGQSHRPAVLS